MFLGIYTGTLSCIVKLPDEVCASHTKREGENKSFLQLKKVRRGAAQWFILLKLFCG